MDYVKSSYRQIPPECRRPLVVGAVAAVQQAAHMRYVLEKTPF